MRTALVTGHSRGIGAAIAAQLLARDVRVLGVARKRNAALAKRFGDRLTEAELDLADVDATLHWLESGALPAFFEQSELGMLVNNAGVLQPIGPLQDQAADAVAQAVTVNVAAPLALSAAFIRATDALPERRILHISSGAGRHAYAGWSVYCASKAALDHHARSVVLDKTPRLRICSLAPGVIDTDMQTEIRSSTEARFPDRQRFVELKREGRLQDPDENARRLVDFLFSNKFGKEPVDELPR